MADDKHYVGGDFYRICDLTGFKVRAGRTKKRWDNAIVREQSWEPRQPQDFVRGVTDYQAVPEPRPRQANVLIGPLTAELTANAAIGTISLTLESSVRMLIGDTVTLPLDNGNEYIGTISSVPTETTILVDPPLSYSSASGTVLTDISAVSQANIG